MVNQSLKPVNHIIVGTNIINIGLKFNMIPRARSCAFVIVHGLLDSSSHGTVIRGRFFMLTMRILFKNNYKFIMLKLLNIKLSKKI